MRRFTKIALIAALPLALAGCQAGQPAKPLTHDKTGRAVVSADQATAYFNKFCYATNNKQSRVRSAVSRDGNMVSETTKLGDSTMFSSKHKTLSVDVLYLPSLGCSVNVVTPEESAQGAAKIAVGLMAKYSVTGINGRKNGGMISLKTSKGRVMVSNATKIEKNSVSITLYSIK